MEKLTELTEPQSCMSRALSGEMTFVLLARDFASPRAIRMWCLERMRMKRNLPDDHQIIEARICANTMERQRDEIRKRLADGENSGRITIRCHRCKGTILYKVIAEGYEIFHSCNGSLAQGREPAPAGGKSEDVGAALPEGGK